MANEFSTTAFEPTYSELRARFCSSYKRVTSEQSRTDAIRHSPLVSLAVKYAVDNPTPQPSNGFAGSFSALTLSKGTVSADTSSNRSPFVASVSQSAPASTSTPPSAQATTFGKPSLPFASTSNSGLLPPTSSLFGASSLTPNVSFGQTANSQPQSHVQNGNSGDAKAEELEKQRSSTQASFAASSASDQGAASGKENVKPATSPSSLRPQATIFSAGTSGAPTTNQTATFSKSNSSPVFSFEYELYGKNAASAPASSFFTSEKFAKSTKPTKKPSALPQYGLLGFDLDNCADNGTPEPILLNTNSPSSVFL